MFATDQSIKCGKTTIILTSGGTLKFVDVKGIERSLYDPFFATQLFLAIRDGSGKVTPIVHQPGTTPATNLEHGGKAVREIPAEAVERKHQGPSYIIP